MSNINSLAMLPGEQNVPSWPRSWFLARRCQWGRIRKFEGWGSVWFEGTWLKFEVAVNVELGDGVGKEAVEFGSEDADVLEPMGPIIPPDPLPRRTSQTRVMERQMNLRLERANWISRHDYWVRKSIHLYYSRRQMNNNISESNFPTMWCGRMF